MIRDRIAVPYASRGSRLGGQILDAIVAGALALVGIALARFGPDALAPLGGWLGFGYYLLADALPGGRSLAKQWLGMAVIDKDTYEPCTIWQSLGRNLLLATLGPIDWVFIFGERHQRLGDKLVGTIVVETARQPEWREPTYR
jgi:uncharacterized RDD family membrane protein YckC